MQIVPDADEIDARTEQDVVRGGRRARRLHVGRPVPDQTVVDDGVVANGQTAQAADQLHAGAVGAIDVVVLDHHAAVVRHGGVVVLANDEDVGPVALRAKDLVALDRSRQSVGATALRIEGETESALVAVLSGTGDGADDVVFDDDGLDGRVLCRRRRSRWALVPSVRLRASMTRPFTVTSQSSAISTTAVRHHRCRANDGLTGCSRLRRGPACRRGTRPVGRAAGVARHAALGAKQRDRLADRDILDIEARRHIDRAATDQVDAFLDAAGRAGLRAVVVHPQRGEVALEAGIGRRCPCRTPARGCSRRSSRRWPPP